MKRIFLLLLTVIAVSSCGPEAYHMLYDMHYPGEAGFVLDNKTMSIVYLDDGIKRDSLYMSNLAQGFAAGIEKQYFGSDESVPVFSLPKDPAGNYASKDTLINLMLETDSDVLFLFDSPTISAGRDSLRGRSYLYVYDALNQKRDSVVAILMDHQIPSGDIELEGVSNYGMQVTGLFANDVRREYYTFMCYNDNAWINSLVDFLQGDWTKAMDAWLKFVADDRNIEKQSCAAYNLSVACYLLEDYPLALEWLDKCQGYYPLTQAATFRRKLITAPGL